MIDLSDARSTAIEAAETAGELVRDGLFRTLAAREKGDCGDVVTDLDLAAESAIIKVIRERFPGTRIISEEAGDLAPASTAADSPWTWLIDPVDGTNNVTVGLPVLSIGITLCHLGAAVASVVHDPVSRRTWSAISRRGAWSTDGSLMSVPDSGQRSRHKPVLAWIQGYGVAGGDPTARALKLVLAQGARRVLDLWAPLACWVMLARGDIDGIVGYRIGELDLHGGALIAQEAGLSVRTFHGITFLPRLRGSGEAHSVIAGTPALIKELSDMVDGASRIAPALALAISPFIADAPRHSGAAQRA